MPEEILSCHSSVLFFLLVRIQSPPTSFFRIPNIVYFSTLKDFIVLYALMAKAWILGFSILSR